MLVLFLFGIHLNRALKSKKGVNQSRIGDRHHMR